MLMAMKFRGVDQVFTEDKRMYERKKAMLLTNHNQKINYYYSLFINKKEVQYIQATTFNEDNSVSFAFRLCTWQ